ncbi:MAG: FHA domain-containing protein [Acidobacteria bacterium]|jgi:ABC-type multidrug transport system ATPase subunit|nr:MAG: FHA domain-containing protein [Acidobacteriota bacterium]GIU82685.1 MAG: ABC transporter ATP-binding protein [Pyrinomonadaceae bacterium]
MQIVIAQYKNGEISTTRTFDIPQIRIGRNPTECQICFESQEYPMVSRRHAEIVWQGKNWILTDLGSSFGTFLNGEKIVSPQTLKINDSIQLGQNGPILKVLAIQTESPLPDAEAEIIPKLLSLSDGRTIEIKKETIWLGRDPSCDIVIDALQTMVSRRHAKIVKQGDDLILFDNQSFNGTLINKQRISTPTKLYHNDEIQLGLKGPVFRLLFPKSFPNIAEADLVGQRSVALSQQGNIAPVRQKTIVLRSSSGGIPPSQIKPEESTLLMCVAFGKKDRLTIGRSPDNDIKLDGLQISNHHAALVKLDGGIFVEDLKSTNGVYLNGKRISKERVSPEDSIQIGAFLIKVESPFDIKVFDTRSKTRIDAVGITKEVRSGSTVTKLLDGISLSIMPNEFIGLLGPSGAGKSTLMDALNGMRPPTSGAVLINNLNLYQNLSALKQSIGYVPQDDIIHRELTVYETLYYVAKLRLSSDVSNKEINQTINEVLDVTGLSERRNVLVSRLSGGQRKRVSIAVELITKPSVIFLDEPTSGLDPATEEKIMILFRQIAESGRTVILTTHAMENVKLFDKIVLLMRGKLVFYGTPQEALEYVGAKSFKELYDKLEEPAEHYSKTSAEGRNTTEQIAEEWKQKFLKTPQYRNNVYEPLKNISKFEPKAVKQKRKLGIFGSIRQWFYLSRRYWKVLLRDKLNLAILFLQAPLIALLTFLVVDKNQPRDFIYFVLSLVSMWFGTSVAAREIIRERPVYNRERMFNLGLAPYVFSKFFVLSIIVGIQCLLLFLPLKLMDLTGLMEMPGVMGGIPQLWTMLLTASVGIAVGLLISALVKTSEMATSLVPLILIPQILFSGLVDVPSGVNKAIGLMMPTAWSFDTMKRFSGLDTLEPEGADEFGETEGKGYYKFIEEENDKIIEKARRDLENYKREAEQKMRDYERELRDKLATGQPPPPSPKLNQPPKIEDPKKIDENLSRFVKFLHPLMNEVLNQIVLMIMFLMLIIAVLIVLRMQDIG